MLTRSFERLVSSESRYLLLLASLSLVLADCNKHASIAPIVTSQAQPSKPLSGPPEITSEEEEGFHDLVFYAEQQPPARDGSIGIRASGKHKGKPIGLEVLFGSNWRDGPRETGLPVATSKGTVKYRSTGANSDALLQALDALYGTKLKPKKMRPETEFTGISLEGDPRDLTKGMVKIKLFFESEKQDEYAELFTNIDLRANRLEIREKDEEYRLPIIKALYER